MTSNTQRPRLLAWLDSLTRRSAPPAPGGDVAAAVSLALIGTSRRRDGEAFTEAFERAAPRHAWQSKLSAAAFAVTGRRPTEKG